MSERRGSQVEQRKPHWVKSEARTRASTSSRENAPNQVLHPDRGTQTGFDVVFHNVRILALPPAGEHVVIWQGQHPVS